MMLKKMIGKFKPPQVSVLIKDGTHAISDMEKANMLARAFADIHKGSHLEERYKKRKEEVMKINRNILNTKVSNMSIMDSEINMSELKRALSNTAYSAPGTDNLCYAMFRKLTDNILEKVLKLFNKVWNEGKLPSMWKWARILPFTKPGKDSSDPGNYRPIALTSHFGKLMEKIIVGRLNYFLEYINPLKGYQTGFRRCKSTTDALVKVCNEIEKSLIMKEVMVAVFLDIEKAYDIMWREGLLIKLGKLGINGKMYNYILDFLSLNVPSGSKWEMQCMMSLLLKMGFLRGVLSVLSCST